MRINNMEYDKLVKAYSPNSTTLLDTFNAFWTGGLICVIGQLVLNGWSMLGFSEDQAGTATSMSMILLGALLTGIGIYDRIAKLAGAGTIVPITGFANSIVSPALEFKTDDCVIIRQTQDPILASDSNMVRVRCLHNHHQGILTSNLWVPPFVLQ